MEGIKSLNTVSRPAVEEQGEEAVGHLTFESLTLDPSRAPRPLTPALITVVGGAALDDEACRQTSTTASSTSSSAELVVCDEVYSSCSGKQVVISNAEDPSQLAIIAGTAVSNKISETSKSIVEIIERYRLAAQDDTKKPWGAKAVFLTRVQACIEREIPVGMVLPAFPFKSPNKHVKVLGTLPDKGEEIALQHLEGLCKAIREVYDKGARIYIVSDGLMYNDLLGVSDQEVWRYGQALRELAKEYQCNNIHFIRLRDLLDDQQHELLEPLTEEDYLSNACKFRDEMVRRYTPSGFDVSTYIKNDADALCTYRGYIKFLETDLANSIVPGQSKAQIKQYQEEIAKKMIARGRAFAIVIGNRFKDYLRLSIHPSTETTKLSISLIPILGKSHMTPWHSSVVYALDGSITMRHAAKVSALTHDLVLENGRASHFRERSHLFRWPRVEVDFKFLYPCGMLITSADPSKPHSIGEIDMGKVRQLAEQNSPIILRGFSETIYQFEQTASKTGTIVPWTWGSKMVVKDAGWSDRNGDNVTSAEAMPFHCDGVFKPKTDPNTGKEISVPNPPRFQFFVAIKTSAPSSGSTLFASSRNFWQHLPAQYDASQLGSLTWYCKSSEFWKSNLSRIPFVVPHPVTERACLQYHQPWPASRTQFTSFDVGFENAGSDDKAEEYSRLVDSLLYDWRVCLRFEWRVGDLLLSDNFAMLHTRTAFSGQSERELWRIHLD